MTTTTTTTTTKPGLAVCPFIILINLFLYYVSFGTGSISPYPPWHILTTSSSNGDRSSLSPGPSASIPRWSLCSHFQRRRSPSSAISCSSSADCTTHLSHHLWHSCVRYCCSHSLEFTAWLSASSTCAARAVSAWHESGVCLVSCTL